MYIKDSALFILAPFISLGLKEMQHFVLGYCFHVVAFSFEGDFWDSPRQKNVRTRNGQKLTWQQPNHNAHGYAEQRMAGSTEYKHRNKGEKFQEGHIEQALVLV